MVKPTPPTPPRATGDQATDQSLFLQWVWSFYQNTVLESGLLDPAFQSDAGEFDPEHLPNPADTSIARSQLTANNAFGLADVAHANAGVANDAIDQLNDEILPVMSSRIDTAQSAANVASANASLAVARSYKYITSFSISGNSNEPTIFFGQNFGNCVSFVQASSYSESSPPIPQGAFVVSRVSTSGTSATVTLLQAPGAGNSVTFTLIVFPA